MGRHPPSDHGRLAGRLAPVGAVAVLLVGGASAVSTVSSGGAAPPAARRGVLRVSPAGLSGTVSKRAASSGAASGGRPGAAAAAPARHCAAPPCLGQLGTAAPPSLLEVEHLGRTEPVPDGTRSQQCESLISPHRDSRTIKECLENRAPPLVINTYCLGASCEAMVQLRNGSSTQRRKIGIVTVDNRTDHMAHAMWRDYARVHGYTYINRDPVITGREVIEPLDSLKMLQDWTTTGTLLRILADPVYHDLDFFMYTELDQWLVRPLARLEPIFEQSGLVSGDKAMAVFAEYPCENVRNGGRYNMGTFLFRRGADQTAIFRAWNESVAYSHESGSHFWPARQGAFSIDVYEKFRAKIATFPSGCPLGSPFGELVGHMTSGVIEDLYDAHMARDLLPMLVDCARQRLKRGEDRPCAVYPPWVNAPCVKCSRSLRAKRTGGTTLTIHYDTCCGDTDSALAEEALESYLAARDPGVAEADIGMLCPTLEMCQNFDTHPLRCKGLECLI